MVVTITFETRQGNANDGFIVITFTDDESPGGVTEWEAAVEVLSPAGVNIWEYADETLTFGVGDSGSIEVPIPLDSLDMYLNGQYTIGLRAVNDSPDPEPIEATYDYEYTAYNSPNHLASDLVTLVTTVDCSEQTLKADDTTAYGDVTIVSRSLTVTPPTVANASPSTTTGVTVTAPLTFTNVPYQTELDVDMEWNEVDPGGIVTAIVSKGTVELYKEDHINCDPGLCGIIKCLAAKFAALKAKAVKCGGWSGLPADEWANYNYIAAEVSLIQLLLSCGLTTEAMVLIDEVKVLLNCDCGCDDDDTPKPL